jgi:hypothetical protein
MNHCFNAFGLGCRASKLAASEPLCSAKPLIFDPVRPGGPSIAARVHQYCTTKLTFVAQIDGPNNGLAASFFGSEFNGAL